MQAHTSYEGFKTATEVRAIEDRWPNVTRMAHIYQTSGVVFGLLIMIAGGLLLAVCVGAMLDGYTPGTSIPILFSGLMLIAIGYFVQITSRTTADLLRMAIKAERSLIVIAGRKRN